MNKKIAPILMFCIIVNASAPVLIEAQASGIYAVTFETLSSTLGLFSACSLPQEIINNLMEESRGSGLNGNSKEKSKNNKRPAQSCFVINFEKRINVLDKGRERVKNINQWLLPDSFKVFTARIRILEKYFPPGAANSYLLFFLVFFILLSLTNLPPHALKLCAGVLCPTRFSELGFSFFRRKLAASAQKIISIITLASFIFSFILAQTVQAAIEMKQSADEARQVLDDFSIPSSIGRITDSFTAQGSGVRGQGIGRDNVVVNIQDLHCHPEVQKNISKILSLLDEKYKLGKVYVEGAAGSVDTSWLCDIKDKKDKNEIVETLVGQGKLTGTEHYSVVSNQPNLLTGLEEEKLYDENLLRLNKILEKKEEFASRLSLLRQELELMKNKYFSSKNKRLERISGQYKNGKIGAVKYYRILIKFAEKLDKNAYGSKNISNINISNYKNINLYLGLIEAGKNLHYKRISEQLQEFAFTLKRKLPYNLYNALLEKTNNFSKLDELYSYLSKSNHDCVGADLSARSPDLYKFFDYIDKGQRINPIELIKEDKRLLEEIRAGLSENLPELEVSFISDFFGYFEDYLNTKLSAEDYEYFSVRFKDFNKLWLKYSSENSPIALEEDYTLLDEFYETNLQRNQCFMRNIKELETENKIPLNPPLSKGELKGDLTLNLEPSTLKNTILELLSNSKIVVIVTGGFHTHGLSKLFREKNISYITITPNVTQDAKTSDIIYRELAQEQAKIMTQTIALRLLSKYGPDMKLASLMEARLLEGVMPGDTTKTYAERKLSSLMKGKITREEIIKAMNDVCGILNSMLKDNEEEFSPEYLVEGDDFHFFQFKAGDTSLKFKCGEDGKVKLLSEGQEKEALETSLFQQRQAVSPSGLFIAGILSAVFGFSVMAFVLPPLIPVVGMSWAIWGASSITVFTLATSGSFMIPVIRLWMLRNAKISQDEQNRRITLLQKLAFESKVLAIPVTNLPNMKVKEIGNLNLEEKLSKRIEQLKYRAFQSKLLASDIGKNVKIMKVVPKTKAGNEMNILYYNPRAISLLDEVTIRAMFKFHESVHFSRYQFRSNSLISRVLNEAPAYVMYALSTPVFTAANFWDELLASFASEIKAEMSKSKKIDTPVLEDSRYKIFIDAELSDSSKKQMANGVAEILERIMNVSDLPPDIKLNIRIEKSLNKTSIRMKDKEITVVLDFPRLLKKHNIDYDKLNNDDFDVFNEGNIAYMIGHEIAHYKIRHKNFMSKFLDILAGFLPPIQRRIEYKADEFSARCLWLLGFNEIESIIENSLKFPEVLRAGAIPMFSPAILFGQIINSKIMEWLSFTHPSLDMRVKRINKIYPAIAREPQKYERLNFNNYISVLNVRKEISKALLVLTEAPDEQSTEDAKTVISEKRRLAYPVLLDNLEKVELKKFDEVQKERLVKIIGELLAASYDLTLVSRLQDIYFKSGEEKKKMIAAVLKQMFGDYAKTSYGQVYGNAGREILPDMFRSAGKDISTYIKKKSGEDTIIADFTSTAGVPMLSVIERVARDKKLKGKHLFINVDPNTVLFKVTDKKGDAAVFDSRGIIVRLYKGNDMLRYDHGKGVNNKLSANSPGYETLLYFYRLKSALVRKFKLSDRVKFGKYGLDHTPMSDKSGSIEPIFLVDPLAVEKAADLGNIEFVQGSFTRVGEGLRGRLDIALLDAVPSVSKSPSLFKGIEDVGFSLKQGGWLVLGNSSDLNFRYHVYERDGDRLLLVNSEGNPKIWGNEADEAVKEIFLNEKELLHLEKVERAANNTYEIDFEECAWLKGGDFYYKIWLQEDSVLFQCYESDRETPKGSVHIFELGKNFRVGKHDEDYLPGNDYLSGRIASFVVSRKKGNIYTLKAAIMNPPDIVEPPPYAPPVLEYEDLPEEISVYGSENTIESDFTGRILIKAGLYHYELWVKGNVLNYQYYSSPGKRNLTKREKKLQKGKKISLAGAFGDYAFGEEFLSGRRFSVAVLKDESSGLKFRLETSYSLDGIDVEYSIPGETARTKKIGLGAVNDFDRLYEFIRQESAYKGFNADRLIYIIERYRNGFLKEISNIRDVKLIQGLGKKVEELASAEEGQSRKPKGGSLGLGAIGHEATKNRYGEDSWQYKLHVLAVAPAWETYALYFTFNVFGFWQAAAGFTLAHIIADWFAKAKELKDKNNLVWRKALMSALSDSEFLSSAKKDLILFFVSFAFIAPFFHSLGWDLNTSLIISGAMHTLYNLFVFKRWLPKWFPMASVFDKAKNNELPSDSAKDMETRKRFGGKALGLFRLMNFAQDHKFKVPEFELVETGVFDKFMENNGITRVGIDKIYKSNQNYSDNYEKIKKIFLEADFNEEQKQYLKEIFNKMRAKGKPIAVRGSSELEDSEEHQFKGIYNSQFFVFRNEEKDFYIFLDKIKIVYASIFSDDALIYRAQKRIPDVDRMAVIIQPIVGQWHGKKFYPPLSGVTLFNPYNPNATVSDINLGLNTKTVRGEYRYRAAYAPDTSGRIQSSGSYPTMESISGELKYKYDTLDMKGEVKSTNGFSLNKKIEYFTEYIEDKQEFLAKVGGDPSKMYFTDQFTSQIDRIARALKKQFGPVELEWSIDDGGVINIYQCRPSYNLKDLYKLPVEIAKVPMKNIVAESNIVSGYGKISAPIIVITGDEITLKKIGTLRELVREKVSKLNFNGYILAMNFSKYCNEKSRDLSQGELELLFPNMIGLIDISEEPIPLGAHWSEYFIENNILTISTTKVNNELINKICKTERDVNYSEIPATMVVNALESKGQVYIEEELKNLSINQETIKQKTKKKIPGKGIAGLEEATPGLFKPVPAKTSFFDSVKNIFTNASVNQNKNVYCGTICEEGHEGSLLALDEQLRRQFEKLREAYNENIHSDFIETIRANFDISLRENIGEENELAELEADLALSYLGHLTEPELEALQLMRRQIRQTPEYLEARKMKSEDIKIFFVPPETSTELFWQGNDYAAGHYNKEGTRIHISLPIALRNSLLALKIAKHELRHISTGRHNESIDKIIETISQRDMVKLKITSRKNTEESRVMILSDDGLGGEYGRKLLSYLNSLEKTNQMLNKKAMLPLICEIMGMINKKLQIYPQLSDENEIKRMKFIMISSALSLHDPNAELKAIIPVFLYRKILPLDPLKCLKELIHNRSGELETLISAFEKGEDIHPLVITSLAKALSSKVYEREQKDPVINLQDANKLIKIRGMLEDHITPYDVTEIMDFIKNAEELPEIGREVKEIVVLPLEIEDKYEREDAINAMIARYLDGQRSKLKEYVRNEIKSILSQVVAVGGNNKAMSESLLSLTENLEKAGISGQRVEAVLSDFARINGLPGYPEKFDEETRKNIIEKLGMYDNEEDNLLIALIRTVYYRMNTGDAYNFAVSLALRELVFSLMVVEKKEINKGTRESISRELGKFYFDWVRDEDVWELQDDALRDRLPESTAANLKYIEEELARYSTAINEKNLNQAREILSGIIYHVWASPWKFPENLWEVLPKRLRASALRLYNLLDEVKNEDEIDWETAVSALSKRKTDKYGFMSPAEISLAAIGTAVLGLIVPAIYSFVSGQPSNQELSAISTVPGFLMSGIAVASWLAKALGKRAGPVDDKAERSSFLKLAAPDPSTAFFEVKDGNLKANPFVYNFLSPLPVFLQDVILYGTGIAGHELYHMSNPNQGKIERELKAYGYTQILPAFAGTLIFGLTAIALGAMGWIILLCGLTGAATAIILEGWRLKKYEMSDSRRKIKDDYSRSARRIRELFIASNPNTSAMKIIEAQGHEFEKVLVNLLWQNIYIPERESAIRMAMKSYPLRSGTKEEYETALREILDTCDNSDNNLEVQEYLKILARLFITVNRKDFEESKDVILEIPLNKGPVLDLASGPNIAVDMKNLNPEMEYIFVDKSFFVTKLLEETANLLSVKNVTIIQEDIMKFKTKIPIGTVRMKNINKYVPHFDERISEITEWLKDDGQLIIQYLSDGHSRRVYPDIYRNHIIELIEKGWQFEFDFNQGLDRINEKLDTLILTKKSDTGLIMKNKNKLLDYLKTIRYRKIDDILKRSETQKPNEAARFNNIEPMIFDEELTDKAGETEIKFFPIFRLKDGTKVVQKYKDFLSMQENIFRSRAAYVVADMVGFKEINPAQIYLKEPGRISDIEKYFGEAVKEVLDEEGRQDLRAAFLDNREYGEKMYGKLAAKYGAVFVQGDIFRLFFGVGDSAYFDNIRISRNGDKDLFRWIDVGDAFSQVGLGGDDLYYRFIEKYLDLRKKHILKYGYGLIMSIVNLSDAQIEFAAEEVFGEKTKLILEQKIKDDMRSGLKREDILIARDINAKLDELKLEFIKEVKKRRNIFRKAAFGMKEGISQKQDVSEKSRELISNIADKIRKNDNVKICFVCSGNMHRSANAHVLLEDKLKKAGKTNVKVLSAGTNVGQTILKLKLGIGGKIREYYELKGLDKDVLDSFRIEQFSKEHLGADIYIAAGESHRQWLMEHYPELEGKIVLFAEMHPDLAKYGAEFPDIGFDEDIYTFSDRIENTIIKTLMSENENTVYKPASALVNQFLSLITKPLAPIGIVKRLFARRAGVSELGKRKGTIYHITENGDSMDAVIEQAAILNAEGCNNIVVSSADENIRNRNVDFTFALDGQKQNVWAEAKKWENGAPVLVLYLEQESFGKGAAELITQLKDDENLEKMLESYGMPVNGILEPLVIVSDIKIYGMIRNKKFGKAAYIVEGDKQQIIWEQSAGASLIYDNIYNLETDKAIKIYNDAIIRKNGENMAKGMESILGLPWEMALNHGEEVGKIIKKIGFSNLRLTGLSDKQQKQSGGLKEIIGLLRKENKGLKILRDFKAEKDDRLDEKLVDKLAGLLEDTFDGIEIDLKNIRNENPPLFPFYKGGYNPPESPFNKGGIEGDSGENLGKWLRTLNKDKRFQGKLLTVILPDELEGIDFKNELAENISIVEEFDDKAKGGDNKCLKLTVKTPWSLTWILENLRQFSGRLEISFEGEVINESILAKATEQLKEKMDITPRSAYKLALLSQDMGDLTVYGRIKDTLNKYGIDLQEDDFDEAVQGKKLEDFLKEAEKMEIEGTFPGGRIAEYIGELNSGSIGLEKCASKVFACMKGTGVNILTRTYFEKNNCSGFDNEEDRVDFGSALWVLDNIIEGGVFGGNFKENSSKYIAAQLLSSPDEKISDTPDMKMIQDFVDSGRGGDKINNVLERVYGGLKFMKKTEEIVLFAQACGKYGEFSYEKTLDMLNNCKLRTKELNKGEEGPLAISELFRILDLLANGKEMKIENKTDTTIDTGLFMELLGAA